MREHSSGESDRGIYLEAWLLAGPLIVLSLLSAALGLWRLAAPLLGRW